MKVLLVMFTRNAEARLPGVLDAAAEYADLAYVLDDRSGDATRRIAERHPLVRNVFTAEDDGAQSQWLHSESAGLALLYRMADLCRPDWVICLDDDMRLCPPEGVRSVLAATPPTVAGLEVPVVSTWDDPDYPAMVPLMGSATSVQVRAWRHTPGLEAGTKHLHNGCAPRNLRENGEVRRCTELTCEHTGWSTLTRRIARVDLYMRLDPDCQLNRGVRYDEGLLFGFRRDEIECLLATYRDRFRAHASSRATNGDHQRSPQDKSGWSPLATNHS